MKWHIYPLARTGPSYVMAATEETEDGRPLRHVTASGPTEAAAISALQLRMTAPADEGVRD